MSKFLRLWCVVFLVAFTFRAPVGPGGSQTALAGTENLLTCTTVPKLFSGYLSNHLQYRELTQELKERTISNYLKFVDSSKTLFLQNEANEWRSELLKMFTSMLVGDCGTLAKLQDALYKRSKLTEEYVRLFVKPKTFKIDDTIELITDPDKRSFAVNEAERREIVRKYVHFQLSTYVDSGVKIEEAKKNLVHRYELITKRLKEDTTDDVLPLFINSFALALDPHSGYFSPDDLEDFQISMGLSLEGIGASLTWKDGFTVVEEIIPGGAADRAKTLQPQDKIVAVAQDGQRPQVVVDMELRKVVKLIRGRAGSGVNLTVVRQGKKTERFTTRIIRAKIDLAEQAAKLSYKQVQAGSKQVKIGILDLPSFYGDSDEGKRSSYEDVKKLLIEAKKERVAGLVLDLSRNGGGLLDDAVKISGLFMRSGGMVATQLSKKDPEVLEDRDETTFYSGPLVVLQSRVSASASEILAGAMKDYRRALIVGDDHSFGKGTVQSVLHLPPGLGAVKVTTGMFFRPGGQSTQHLGVVSDVTMPSRLATDEIGERTLDYSIPNKKIDPFRSSFANSDDPQNHWNPVSDDLITQLQKQSEKRQKDSKEFQEITADVKKAADKKTGVIKLAEVRAKASKKTPAEKGSKKKDEVTPQLTEAVALLSDYLAATEKKTLSARD